MHDAGRILGTEIASTAPLFLAVLAVHVLAGLTAAVTGAAAALTRKGSHRHIRAGRWFYRAITVVFATAVVLGAMRWRQDYHLVIIGTVAFASATGGVVHRRLRRPGDTGHITGMGIAYIAMLTAFYVDNGPHLPLLGRLPSIVFWGLPSAVGAPIVVRAITKRVHMQTRTGSQWSAPQMVSTGNLRRAMSGDVSAGKRRIRPRRARRAD